MIDIIVTSEKPESGNYREFYFKNEKYKNCIVLYRNNWDDFYYKTLFNAWYYDNECKAHDIGKIKIYTKEYDYPSNNYEIIKYLAESFNVKIENNENIEFKISQQLNENFCSLGQSINYYINLKENVSEYKKILKRLNDIATDDNLKKKFINYDGVKISLLRESSANKALEEARDYLKGEEKSNDLSFTLRYTAPYSSLDTDINFNFSKHEIFPYRINALVGKNGTGKTSLMTRLADLLSGFSDDKDEDYKASFAGERPKFEKIISISYSAFDSFKKKKYEDSLYSYVYCGIQTENGNLSLDQLKENFKKSLEKVKELGRHEDWKSILSELLENKHEEIIEQIETYLGEENSKSFELSSGQQILISTITEVLSNIEKESIILFDEPEIHLHPNAISNVMRMFNKMLEKYNSYAIFATHSPIILQELLSESVIVLNRIENILSTRKPIIECFGEEISDITSEIFNVLVSESNYKSILKLASIKMEEAEVLKFFKGKLGLSARIYLRNLYEKGE